MDENRSATGRKRCHERRAPTPLRSRFGYWLESLHIMFRTARLGVRFSALASSAK